MLVTRPVPFFPAKIEKQKSLLLLKFTGRKDNFPPEAFHSLNEALSAYNQACVVKQGQKLPDANICLIERLMQHPRLIKVRQEEYENTRKYQGFIEWLIGPYKEAHELYTKKLYREAQSLEELIKVRPDWAPDKIVAKYQSLHGLDPVKLGKIPKTMGSKKCFNMIAGHLYKYATENAYSDEPFEIPPLRAGNRTYTFKPVTKGRTAKLPVITTDDRGRKYMIKIDPSGIEGPLNFQLADSVALQAVIDYYLTANNCDNAAKLLYFDEQYNTALYEYVDGESNSLDFSTENSTLDTIIPDFYKLGMTFTDTIGEDNILWRGNKNIIVDTGYSYFECALRPTVAQYHWKLPKLGY